MMYEERDNYCIQVHLSSNQDLKFSTKLIPYQFVVDSSQTIWTRQIQDALNWFRCQINKTRSTFGLHAILCLLCLVKEWYARV